MNTLKEIKCGETVTVVKLEGEGPVKRRIMDMGITKGFFHICPQGRSAGRSNRNNGAEL